MIKRLLITIACFICVTFLSAQNADKKLIRSIETYFENYKSENIELKACRLDKKRRGVVVSNKSRRVTVFANDNFGAQLFTTKVVNDIYSDIRKLLPRELRKYKLEVVTCRRPIEELVPPILTNKKVAGRHWGTIDYEGNRWVHNISRPYIASKGLDGRHLAVWQSHGRVFANDKNSWQWQRPSLYCTTEDLFTQSIVVPFLIPMLENAGAIVYTPRERDWQPNSVIVDSDRKVGKSIYSEDTDRGVRWFSVDSGYVSRDGYYVDGDNPFVEGTSRCVAASPEEKGATAVAEWRPEIPESGEYAVYISYAAAPDAVPDARYSVLHAGGVTNFVVNQRMGGGSWVYLGTFYFKKGSRKEQGVKLTNISNYKGVVCADAVRFGGGMGIVARGDSLSVVTSGLPRYLEGARYALQVGGFPREVYSPSDGERDYNDDINCRSHALNYLSGGSVFNPDTTGLNVPIEMSFGFHSDAGISAEDSLVGSLGIVTTEFNGDSIEAGLSRYMARDIISYLLVCVQRDIQARYGIRWNCRGILDRSYSESRLPVVPAMIFESLSHQNFADMRLGHDPDFKFTMARAVYKALLKQICFLRGQEYVVQPLPVSNFALQFAEKDNVLLSWDPVEDSLEPTATPKRYIVYTRINDGGFNNGMIVDGNSCMMRLVEGVQYSFKVTAVNDGGESLPSEILSASISKKDKGRVMIVNGFHRLSPPEIVNTASKAGFDLDSDPGIAYRRTPEYSGRQLDYERSNIGYEDGLGLSGNDFEGLLMAGNSFDYPYMHGKSLSVNGYSYVSCSSEAVVNGKISLGGYDAVDLILGAEKQGGKGSLLSYNYPYKTFPTELQKALESYCANGGRLFVSGAYIASDMYKNEADREFIRRWLKFDYGGSVFSVTENRVLGSNADFEILRSVNEQNYAVASPDILVPVGDAFIPFIYAGNKESAAVAYSGDYKVLSTSFPFEAIADEWQRNRVMKAVISFLLGK
ncbi:MAG: xanthan lyase [Bacteroidaceae bacterium]|nr:xanthan lyase [Bacteroidaceae bacterium]